MAEPKEDVIGIPAHTFMNASVDARCVSLAILEVAKELRKNREANEASPGWKMAEIALQQVQAQMGGGVVVVPGTLKPGH